MPAADRVMVERMSPDVFRIEWWRRSGERVEELTNRKMLTHRIDVLTHREAPEPAMEHAP